MSLHNEIRYGEPADIAAMIDDIDDPTLLRAALIAVLERVARIDRQIETLQIQLGDPNEH